MASPSTKTIQATLEQIDNLALKLNSESPTRVLLSNCHAVITALHKGSLSQKDARIYKEMYETVCKDMQQLQDQWNQFQKTALDKKIVNKHLSNLYKCLGMVGPTVKESEDFSVVADALYRQVSKTVAEPDVP